jgi:RNA polymerase sigma-70 factor (ECF subfamily)
MLEFLDDLASRLVHPHLARENQLALTLKALCGFGNAEIARALLVGEEVVKKRLQRATRELVEHQIALDPPVAGDARGVAPGR